MAGRKSLKDELGVLRRYSDLSTGYFRVLKERLDSKSKREQEWAVEQLTKAFVKMIPQQIDGDGEGGPIQIKLINYGNNLTLPVRAAAIPASSTSSA